MSNKKLGFIGCGNMAQAIMGGVIQAGLCAGSDIYASDAFPKALETAKAKFGINTTADNKEVAGNCDCLLLAVKPQFYPVVINEIKSVIKEGAIIITIAAGQSLALIAESFGKEGVRIVRTMPNTPALVGQGMTAVCPNQYVQSEDLEYVKSLLASFGKAEVVPEYMMDAVTAVSGSSPAYVFMMIEAMADAAVLKGMSRNLAYTFAAQAVLGSAKMVLELGKHPGELKDMVTSPAGTTIEAIKVLEATGFRGSIIAAIEACAERSAEL